MSLYFTASPCEITEFLDLAVQRSSHILLYLDPQIAMNKTQRCDWIPDQEIKG